ncbi:hypothetical protein C8R44DRAFT_827585 [Mycena epipterygia]|nr:hypothetical protein C8R44DRAFT_827585 [Mycena epipterygia]
MQTDLVFFQRQTVFLTGGTGNLGGCLLFKLTLAVDTQRIYVLVRGSAARAEQRWNETMPKQIRHILAKHKLRASVTLVIHSAANISLTASLRDSLEHNCLPSLELARLAGSFKHLERFVYISTAYVNCFLPDGPVEERIYEVGDAEAQLTGILETGEISPDPIPHFLWPCSFVKHLTERLLISRNPHLPLLIVRPTTIGPAIAQPYPYYGPLAACPLSAYIEKFIIAPDSGVIHTTYGGANIADEIPVDLVANLVLLHAARGTTGVVHASAQSYVPRSLAHLLADICAVVPTAVFTYVADGSVAEGKYARFLKILSRDRRFSNAKSGALKDCGGPLSIDLKDHDAAGFMRTRVRVIAENLLYPGAKL